MIENRPSELAKILQYWPENPALSWWIFFLRSLQNAASTPEDSLTVFQKMLADTPERLSSFEKFIFSEVDRRSHFSLFADAGLTRDTAFLGELLRRLGNRILPPAPDPFELADLFRAICRDRTSAQWLRRIPKENWRIFFDFIIAKSPNDSSLKNIFKQSLQHSVLIRLLPDWGQRRIGSWIC